MEMLATQKRAVPGGREGYDELLEAGDVELRTAFQLLQDAFEKVHRLDSVCGVLLGPIFDLHKCYSTTENLRKFIFLTRT